MIDLDSDQASLVPLRDRALALFPPLLLAASAGLAAVAGSYAVTGRTPGFVVTPIAAVVTTVTPAIVVRFAITVLGDLGKLLAFGSAIGITVGVFAVVAGSIRVASTRLVTGSLRANVVAAFLGGAVATIVAFPLAGEASSAVAAGGSVFLVLAVPVVVSVIDSSGAVESERRAILSGVATAVSVGVAGTVLGTTRSPDPSRNASIGGSVVDDLLATATDRSLDVDGLEPLVSDRFYTVDVAQVNPDPAAEDWTVTVTGAVESEKEFTYQEVKDRESQNRFISLRCVGESLNGKKLDNALWTGTSLRDLVEEANPQGEYVMLRAADDFYEEFPIEALEGSMLAYGMNGRPLPRSHGAPARALIPGHWGEINVKWLTEIEILEKEAKGYWEKRGWHGTGPVNTVAKLHVDNRLEDGRIEVAGHAYAGIRGVSAVEVSTDGGETWTEATLSEPLPGEDVWRQWVYRYDPPDGPHEVVVRTIESDGTVQPKDETNAYPSGATGWVSKTISP